MPACARRSIRTTFGRWTRTRSSSPRRSMYGGRCATGGGELRRQPACKAQWPRRTHIGVDPWFPNTRRCNACHALREGLTKPRWRCEACGAEHDRDINVARNLEQAGLRCPADNGRRNAVGQCAWRVMPAGCSRLDPGVLRYPVKRERTPRRRGRRQPPKPLEGPAQEPNSGATLTVKKQFLASCLGHESLRIRRLPAMGGSPRGHFSASVLRSGSRRAGQWRAVFDRGHVRRTSKT